MNSRIRKAGLALSFAGLVIMFGGHYLCAQTNSSKKPSAAPPSSIPTFSTENIAREGFFYAGGEYAGPPGKEVMRGAMYVEVVVPKQIRQRYPIAFFHGAGQTGTDWRQTPDGRPGWLYYLVNQGYVVYMVDYPARGRSAYIPDMDGKLSLRTALDLEQIWTAPVTSGANFPRMKLYTQWPSDSPKKGMMGDPVFDNFIKTQVQYIPNDIQADLVVKAGVALLEQIGRPVILVGHSQGGGFVYNIADARPKLTAGVIEIEPGGPQIGIVNTAKVEYTGKIGNAWGITNMPMHYDPPVNSPEDLKTYLEEKSDRPGDEVPCYLQKEPVHKLVNLENIPVLSISAEGTYHRVFDACIPKWLMQAGVKKSDFVRLEDVGIHGNMHEMFLDKNSDVIIKFIDDWIRKNIK